MQLPDVNILVGAYRPDATAHAVCRRWLDDVVSREEVFGVSELACSGFLRIVTHPRIFNQPDTIVDALGFVDALRQQPNCAIVSPGERHWSIFTSLCGQADARGDLVADAYFAALAIESGNEWITFDRDFARFPGLRWRRPGD